MDELITLKKFNTLEEASSVIELLEKNNIGYNLDKQNTSSDIVFAGNTLGSELHLCIKPEDYESAQELLKGLTEINIEDLDKDYYLFTFSETELSEILQKPDEWSYNDYLWAQEILKQRGKEVDISTIENWKKKRLELLATPDKISNKYLVTAYLFCLLGGFIGFFMGTHIINYNKTLPNGQKVFAYDEESRNKGLNIKRIGGISFLLWIVLILIVLIY
jgi:hypothetical protein